MFSMVTKEQWKKVEQDRMEVYVTLTDGESIQTREKNIKETHDIIDTMKTFQRVEVIRCE